MNGNCKVGNLLIGEFFSALPLQVVDEWKKYHPKLNCNNLSREKQKQNRKWDEVSATINNAYCPRNFAANIVRVTLESQAFI